MVSIQLVQILQAACGLVARRLVRRLAGWPRLATTSLARKLALTEHDNHHHRLSRKARLTTPLSENPVYLSLGMLVISNSSERYVEGSLQSRYVLMALDFRDGALPQLPEKASKAVTWTIHGLYLGLVAS